MTEYVKRTIVRMCKLMHYILSVLMFGVYYHFADPCGMQGSGKTMIHFGTVMCIYAVILLFSLRSYSSYTFDRAGIRMLVYSQLLADFVADIILYAVLSIEILAFVKPLPMIILFITQLLFNVIWSYFVILLRRRINKPKRTVLIYRGEPDLRRIEEVFKFKHKFQVIKKIESPDDDIHTLMKELECAEAVFVSGINASLRNGVVKYCVEKNKHCYVAPSVGDVIMMGSKNMDIFSVPIVRMTRANFKLEYILIKRTADIIFSLLGIIVFSPVMLCTALAVKLYDKGPVLYKQVRLTKDGKKFKILKFRSMSVNAENDGVARLASKNDSRITPVGKVIRSCRFDEFPQLFNILKGDMTIVGPRPERPEIAEEYEEIIPAFALRLQVKAGLTGHAQIYGKYNTDPYDKLRMDLIYINRMSFAEDVKLMLATVKVLFMKESTSGVESGQTTATRSTEKQKEAEKQEEYR